MRDDKEMNVQINEFQKLLEDLKAEGMSLPEKFVVGVLIEKLSDSWSDYKNNLKHKQKNFTIEEIMTHILIEDSNRKASAKARMTTLKANLVQIRKNHKKAIMPHNVEDDREEVYLGDSSTTKVLGKGKILLKLTSEKTLALVDVLHVPTMRANLISISLLERAGVKVSFEYDKIIMTKNNVFVGKGYCNQGLFVLNISDVINGNVPTSAYMVESISLWHARLGHVNVAYIKKMQSLGLISGLDSNNIDKCEIYVEAKSTNKTCFSRKIGSKTADCMLIGYAEHSAAYRFLVLKSDVLDYNTIIEIKNAEFFEYIYPLSDKISHTPVETNSEITYNEELRRMSTPFDANSQLKKNNGDLVAQSKYVHSIGSLMHLINFTRPDIAYAVCRLSRYTYNPNKEYWSALARLMKYLRGTMNYGILYSGFLSTLEGYNDANWISDSDETKSTSGYVFTLGGGAISWKSAKQTIIARSTVESEFVALELASFEANWLRNFLANIPLIKDALPHVSMQSDCQAAIAIAKNKSYNCKSRHMKLRYDVIKQLLRDGIISIDYVKSEINLTDPLTKPVGRKLIL
ncbi:uncharacterized protein LOC142180744 [Nicotiana tabacum]|uniref:Uncharacterized protein LOC142180744 n=1 Tax=Nicotiana tabacum TaxID=4097 RepID=A0AC58UHE2_TOBAC